MNIIITGASSGVGFEAVLELMLSGKHQVIALARSEDKLGRLLEIALGLNPDCVLYPVAFDIVHDDYHSLQEFISSRFGNVVVLTDGLDRANRVSQRQMLDAVEATPYHVYTLGIGRELDDSVLSRIGKSGYVRVEENSGMRTAFQELAELIRSAAGRYYLLRYCSPSRAGRHVVRVEVAVPAGSGQLQYVLDASRFRAGCDAARAPVLKRIKAR